MFSKTLRVILVLLLFFIFYIYYIKNFLKFQAFRIKIFKTHLYSSHPLRNLSFINLSEDNWRALVERGVQVSNLRQRFWRPSFSQLETTAAFNTHEGIWTPKTLLLRQVCIPIPSHEYAAETNSAGRLFLRSPTSDSHWYRVVGPLWVTQSQPTHGLRCLNNLTGCTLL